MTRIALSPAAAGLLRALINRGGVDRDRILLTEFRSVDWQSLTFVGERHEIRLRVAGSDSSAVVTRILAGLEDAELAIPGHLVADITMIGDPVAEADGSATIALEALTVVQD